MKRLKKGIRIFSLSICAILLFSFTASNEDIKGWFLAGSNPESYDIGLESDTQRNGKVAYLKATKEKIKGFGTIMQQFTPKSFLGEKVKLTGYIKSANVDKWAGMWMRVDGKGKRKVLSFDNMQNRPIKGTTGWQKYEIILDVPKESRLIAYGVLLSGTGIIWLDDMKFEIIETNEANTGSGRSLKLDRPTNTDFEENK